MMRKSAILAAALVLLVGGVAACGGDDDNDNNNDAATEQPEPQANDMAQQPDIVALAQDTPDLETLVEAVVAAELAATLQEPGPYTVFAPTNEAFAEVDDLDQLLQPRNRDQLAEILTYHVVAGEVRAADLEDGQTVETVQGETLEITIDGDTVEVNDATVVEADVEASNGVVHVIDAVLVPGS
jgi:uncharacterized surface protein with fasciclin (FAS1) repeats